MKKFNKKSLVLLIAVALLLTISVSGTVAYLVAGTDELVNTFKPSKVEITVDDKIEDGTKKDVTIYNSSNIPVYIRVAIVGNWVTNQEPHTIVGGWNDYDAIMLRDGWKYMSDGYFYYQHAVQPSTTELVMFDLYKPDDSIIPPGAHLEMTIIAQAIQTEPAQVLTDAHWGWNPSSSAQ